MSTTEPGFNAAELRNMALNADLLSVVVFNPASILALLDEIERLRQVAESDRQTAQDYADEVAAAHVERESLRARLAAVAALVREWEIAVGPAPYTIRKKLRAALAEGGVGPDPDGGIDLTDEEFAAFLKAAKG